MNFKSCFVLSSIILATSLFANYKKGEEIFKEKCSSCHSGYIPIKRLKDNFFQKNNQLLHLKAPTINMLVYAIMKSPKKIGSEKDNEMRQVEIEEYLKDCLRHPNSLDTLFNKNINHYFESKPPIMNLDDSSISSLAQYIMGYSSHHKSKKSSLKRHISGFLDMKKLQDEASKSGKIIIIEASSAYCHYCKKMDRDVFSSSDIMNTIQRNFIFVEVDIERTKLPKQLAKVYKHITPSFFFISSDGRLLSSYPGSWTKSDFLSILRDNISKKASK